MQMPVVDRRYTSVLRRCHRLDGSGSKSTKYSFNRPSVEIAGWQSLVLGISRYHKADIWCSIYIECTVGNVVKYPALLYLSFGLIQLVLQDSNDLFVFNVTLFHHLLLPLRLLYIYKQHGDSQSLHKPGTKWNSSQNRFGVEVAQI